MARSYQQGTRSRAMKHILKGVKDSETRALIEGAYRVGFDHGYMQALEEMTS